MSSLVTAFALLVGAPDPIPAPAAASALVAPIAPSAPAASEGDGVLARLPSITWHTPEEVGDGWAKAREAKGAAERLRAVVALGLPTWVCVGLVDLQALPAASEAGLGWKDRVRGRAWARPTLARLLVEAHRAPAWRAMADQAEGRAIEVGDVSQAGCGLVDPGVLTRVVRGAAATELLGRATLVAGRPVARELARADELADRPGRFAVDQPILLDTEVDARAASEGPLASPVLLARIRRYSADPLPTPGELQALERDVGGILARGALASATEGDGLVREHWVDPATARQLVIVRRLDSLAVDRKTGFHLASAIDLRIGPFAVDRPGAFRSEVRWLRAPDAQPSDAAGPLPGGGAAPVWERWRLVEEGSHATHQTGRDADLSYPVTDPAARFLDTPSALAAIDVAATWRWFEALAGASAASGLGLERILVGPRVLARLLAEVPGARASALIKDKVIRVVAGHDDHAHIRIAVPSDALDAASRAALE